MTRVYLELGVVWISGDIDQYTSGMGTPPTQRRRSATGVEFFWFLAVHVAHSVSSVVRRPYIDLAKTGVFFFSKIPRVKPRGFYLFGSSASCNYRGLYLCETLFPGSLMDDDATVPV